MMINLSSASDDQQNSDQVKGKINKRDVYGKVLYFFDFGHNLRNAEKNAYPGQKQQNAPHELKLVLFIGHSPCLPSSDKTLNPKAPL